MQVDRMTQDTQLQSLRGEGRRKQEGKRTPRLTLFAGNVHDLSLLKINIKQKHQ